MPFDYPDTVILVHSVGLSALLAKHESSAECINIAVSEY